MNLIEFCKKVKLLDENQLFDDTGNMYLVFNEEFEGFVGAYYIKDLLSYLVYDNKYLSLDQHDCISVTLKG